MLWGNVASISSFVFLVSSLLPSGSVPSPLDRKSMEARLRAEMVGRVAVLRNFYKDDDLAFDAEGNLIGNGKTGSWTYYARVEVYSLSLNQDALIIKGDRNVLQWELSAREFRNYTLDDHPVRIAIRVTPDSTEGSLESAIGRVFVTRDAPLSDFVPDYWKEIVTTDRERRREWEQKRASVMRSVSDAASVASRPRLRSPAEGIQTSPDPFLEVFPTNLTLSFVVDENGDVRGLEIEKPVGLGLDDAIAETILHWKWEPAIKDDRHVAMLMYARVLFQAQKGHIDPYHTQPCRAMPNLRQC
jgi:hypothetical protein